MKMSQDEAKAVVKVSGTINLRVHGRRNRVVQGNKC